MFELRSCLKFRDLIRNCRSQVATAAVLRQIRLLLQAMAAAAALPLQAQMLPLPLAIAAAAVAVVSPQLIRLLRQAMAAVVQVLRLNWLDASCKHGS